MEAAQGVIGLQKAAETFTEVVSDALSGIAPDIGLHLPSIDASMYDSPSGTLYEVGEMGYTMVEAGCYYNGTLYGVKAEEFYSSALSSGLKVAGIYVNKFYEKPIANPAEPTDGDEDEIANGKEEKEPCILSDEDLRWWEKVVESAVAMKCRYITTPSYPIESNAKTISDYAQYFSFIGKMAVEKGITFCYHPTRNELKQQNGVSIFDQLAEATAQAGVEFQIDTLEAIEAELDICALIKRYGKRIASLHLHDAAIVTESGRIDFDKIVRQARESEVKDIFIAVSNFPLPPQNCVERSLRNVELLDSLKF